MLPRLMRPVGSSDLMPSSPTSSTDDIFSILVCLCNLGKDGNIQKTICWVGGGGNASAAPITITDCYVMIFSRLKFPVVGLDIPFDLPKRHNLYHPTVRFCQKFSKKDHSMAPAINVPSPACPSP